MKFGLHIYKLVNQKLQNSMATKNKQKKQYLYAEKGRRSSSV